MSKEIHEDRVLVEPGVAWIRQLWLPTLLTPAVLNRTLNPSYLTAGRHANATVQVPTDFSSLSRFDMVIRSTDTALHNMTTQIWFGQCGELWNTHSLGLVLGVNLVLNTFVCYDLLTPFAALFANLQAGDNLWFDTRNDAGNPIWVYGVDMRYA